MKVRRSCAGALPALVALLIVAACGQPSGSPASSASSSPAAPSSQPSVAPTPTAPAQGTGGPTASPGSSAVRAYFMLGSFTGGGGLVPVERAFEGAQVDAPAAMAVLLDATFLASLDARPAMYSAVPDGTRLLGLTVDGGVAVVNLSGEFAVAPTATRAQAYGQVVYTLTQFPTISGVRFEIAGAAVPAAVPGGSGATTRTVGRNDYLDLLPAIFVDDPAWGGALRNGARVTGSADVFEAQFRLVILDASGRSLADQPVIATCGTGCRGTFDTTVAYRVGAAQRGTLRVFEPSAKDGSSTNIVEYAVLLTP